MDTLQRKNYEQITLLHVANLPSLSWIIYIFKTIIKQFHPELDYTGVTDKQQLQYLNTSTRK